MVRARRVTARPVPAVAAGTWKAAGNVLRKLTRPPTPPQTAYTQQATAPVGNQGIASTVVSASGTAQVSVGPQGIGTRWYPQQATVSTSSGAADSSTCTIYLGLIGVQAAVVGQSYAGGGDTIGLAVPLMQPGDLLIAVWTGAKTGDQATIRIIGDQDVLVPG